MECDSCRGLGDALEKIDFDGRLSVLLRSSISMVIILQGNRQVNALLLGPEGVGLFF
jgi:hypothetical protein